VYKREMFDFTLDPADVDMSGRAEPACTCQVD
jgi:hypothetical protein